MQMCINLSVIRILRLRSGASEIWIAGLVDFRFLLDSGLHVADAVKVAPYNSANRQLAGSCSESKADGFNLTPGALPIAHWQLSSGPGI
jgi:hypothetical protein